MRRFATPLPTLLLLAATVCAQQSGPATAKHTPSAAQEPVGFDSNDYPGDDALPLLRQHFAFAGYWLTNPPGARQNGWIGKREALLRNDFGFLVLANGRLEAEIGKAKRSGTPPTTLGEKDAADAVDAVLETRSASCEKSSHTCRSSMLPAARPLPAYVGSMLRKFMSFITTLAGLRKLSGLPDTGCRVALCKRLLRSRTSGIAGPGAAGRMRKYTSSAKISSSRCQSKTFIVIVYSQERY